MTMTPSDMSRIMDVDNQFYEPRDDGIIISEGFARKLNVHEGDLLEVSGNGLTRDLQTTVQVTVGNGASCPSL